MEFGFLRATVLLGALLATLPGAFTVATAQDTYPDVAGTWFKNSNSKQSLTLSLTQVGGELTGQFRSGKRRWTVSGSITRQGQVDLRRLIPLSELRKTNDAGRQAAFRAAGYPDEIGGTKYLVGRVSLRLDARRRELEGYYQRFGVKGARGEPNDYDVYLVDENIRLGQNEPGTEPVLIDGKQKFHRLFIIGPGNKPSEDKDFLSAANLLKGVLSDRNRSGAGSTTRTIDARQGGATRLEILQQIHAFAEEVMPGDQALIYYAGHSWSEVRSSDLQGEHRKRFAAAWQKHQQKLPKNMSKVERDNLLRKFYWKYLHEIQENRVLIKDIKEEIFREYLILGNGEKLYDTEFARAINPLVRREIPLTVILDSCYGGGFGDNIASSSNVRVIGVGVESLGPYDRPESITTIVAKLIRETSRDATKPAVLESRDAFDRLEEHYPGYVGAPYDDLRQVPLKERSVCGSK